MSVYVGIDVHRKRSQVAVVDQSGEVLANPNVPNGVEAILGVIGGLPPGTPAAFEAGFGWGWLVQLLEDTVSPGIWCTHCGARRSPRPG
jgi:transposase